MAATLPAHRLYSLIHLADTITRFFGFVKRDFQEIEAIKDKKRPDVGICLGEGESQQGQQSGTGR